MTQRYNKIIAVALLVTFFLVPVLVKGPSGERSNIERYEGPGGSPDGYSDGSTDGYSNESPDGHSDELSDGYSNCPFDGSTFHGTIALRSGELAENTTWDASGSPHLVQGNVTVPSGRQLNITAGATVVFQGNFTITVEGTLDCRGNISSPVVLTRNSSAANSSNSTIILAAGSGFVFHCTEFRNVTGLVWRGNGTLDGVNFTNCSLPVRIEDIEQEAPIIANTTFTGSDAADVSLLRSNISLLDSSRRNGAAIEFLFMDGSSHLTEWKSLSVRTRRDTGENLSGCDVRVGNATHELYASPRFGRGDLVTNVSGMISLQYLANISSVSGWDNTTLNVSLLASTDAGEWNLSVNLYRSDSLAPRSILAFTSDDIFPPDAPVELIITPLNNTALDISWRAGNSTDVIKHGIYLLDEGNWSQRANLSVPESNWTLSPVMPGTNYSVRLRAFDDAGLGSPFTDAINHTAGDVEPPEIIQYAPGGENVSRTLPISIRFSEPMDTHSVMSAFSVHPIANHGTDFQDNNTVLVARPISPMYPSALYSVKLNTEATDAAGNHLTQNLSFNFTTEPDTEGPRVVYTSPTGNNVSRDAHIEVHFDEWVNETSFVDGFHITPHVEGGFNSSNGRKTFTFHPNSPLYFGITYNVTVPGTVKDMIGNAMGVPHSFNFTIISVPDQSTPSITDHGPVGENVSVHSIIFLNFSEPMNHTAKTALGIEPEIVFEYFVSPDQMKFEFKPVRPLTGSTTYHVTVAPDAADLLGNTIARLFTFNFTTHETRAPRVVTTEPENNEVDVDPRTEIMFRFDEPVYEGKGFLIDISPTADLNRSLSTGRRELIIVPKTGLVGGISYRVEIRNLTDVHGNVLSSVTLIFSTLEDVGPVEGYLTVYEYSPDAERNVPPDSQIYVTFYESLDRSGINDNSFRLLVNNETPVAGSVSYDGEYLFFIPRKSLLPDTNYTAVVSGLRSTGGRSMEGPFHFTFITVPPEPPETTQVVGSRPENGSTVDYRADNVTLWIRFSAPMDVDSVSGNLTILPEVNFSVRGEEGGRRMMIELRENMTSSTKYNVTLGKMTLDANGTPLGVSYSYVFTTRSPEEDDRDGDRIKRTTADWIEDNLLYFVPLLIILIVLVIIYLWPGKVQSLPGEHPCPHCGKPVLSDDPRCWNCEMGLLGEEGEEAEDDGDGDEDEDDDDDEGGDDEDEDDDEGGDDEDEDDDDDEGGDDEDEDDDKDGGDEEDDGDEGEEEKVTDQ